MTQSSKSLSLFQLRTAEGELRGPLDHWQKREMVIALLHPSGCSQCEQVQQLLLAQEARWKAGEAALLTVALEKPPLGPAWAKALVDPTGEVVRSLPGVPERDRMRKARILVSNRFAELYACVDAHHESAGTVVSQVNEWLDFAQRQCGECQAPLPWPES